VLEKAVVLVLGEDDVVEQLDTQGLAGLPQPPGNLAVLIAGVHVARGMVVGGQYGGSPILQRVGENFPRVDDGAA